MSASIKPSERYLPVDALLAAQFPSHFGTVDLVTYHHFAVIYSTAASVTLARLVSWWYAVLSSYVAVIAVHLRRVQFMVCLADVEEPVMFTETVKQFEILDFPA